MNINNQPSGIIFVDKPYNISSAKVGFTLKKIWPRSKIGHGGTLDPLATGMLPIMIGNATKLSSIFLGGRKVYIAALKLGITTSTLDQEGEVTSQSSVKDVHYQNLSTVLNTFIGKVTQVPPIYSALKYQGKPLYWYARKGLSPPIPIRAREIEIFSLKLLQVDQEGLVWIEVICESGTYIRTLAQDIGIALGCGATMWQLRRTSVNNVDVENMITLDSVRSHHLLSAESLFLDMDSYEMSYPELYNLVHTGKFYLEGDHRIYYQQRFVGILRGSHKGFNVRYLEYIPIN